MNLQVFIVQFPFNYHIISELIKPLPVQQHQLTMQFSTGIVIFCEVSCSRSHSKVRPCLWLPQCGSNTRITESKSAALPLGYEAIYYLQAVTVRPMVDTPCFQSFGADEGSRTLTLKHMSLNHACIPISPHPHICEFCFIRTFQYSQPNYSSDYYHRLLLSFAGTGYWT